jgi:hypothetical protein
LNIRKNHILTCLVKEKLVDDPLPASADVLVRVEGLTEYPILLKFEASTKSTFALAVPFVGTSAELTTVTVNVTLSLDA